MIRARALPLLLLALVPGACNTGGLVDGSCRDGLVYCDGKCTNLATDPANCGACRVVCPAGRICHEGQYCEGFDAGVAGRAGAGGARAGGAGRGGAAGIAGFGGACLPPYDTAQHCGDCNTACTSTTPLCDCLDGSCNCVANCTAPALACGGSCIDPSNNPAHCGACDNYCPTGLCESRSCVGSLPGHIIVMCLDLAQTAQQHPQTVLLGNAVFLSRRSPVRVLAYEEYAAAGAIGRLVETLNYAVAASGRTYQISTAVSAAQVETTLRIKDYEALIVLDQPEAPAGVLGPTGSSWAQPLDDFVQAGGTVIVLDGGGGVGEMGALTTTAGLFAIDGETALAPTDLVYNRAPSDSVGASVLSPFRTLSDSCTFVTTASADQTTIFVVTDSAPGGTLGRPMVVHRVSL